MDNYSTMEKNKVICTKQCYYVKKLWYYAQNYEASIYKGEKPIIEYQILMNLIIMEKSMAK